MKGRMLRPAVVALAIVGALAVAGGIAYATIPDASGVIHGCYKKSSPNQGTLRVIDTDKAQACSNAETALDWSQTGPPGPKGDQGLQGPTGPSDVWSVDGFGANKNLPISTWVNLATTSTLPAGSYFVQAEAEADSITSTPTEYSCNLVDSSSNEYQDTNANSSGDWVTIPVQAVVTLASPDTISLQCFANTALSEAFNWQLAAIKIGEVHS
jgi:hypothetical protein